MTDPTIDYYNKNSAVYAADTQRVNFNETREHFTAKLKPGAFILDFGCGAGRDSRAFMEQGFRVEATDGSGELCKIAAAYAAIPVRQLLFQNLDEHEKYDAIWACASILHLPRYDLLDVFRQMAKALKPSGLIYTSFKYGTFEGDRHERHFTDFNESLFSDFISDVTDLAVEECWTTGDVRPGREDEKWLNIILRKNEITK